MYRLLSFIIAVIMVSCSSKKIPFYIGTYTDGDSKGIYKANFDVSTGDITDIQLAAETTNPSFIAFSPNKNVLYAVNETDAGSVSAFKVKDDGNLELINELESNGGSPCHIAINKDGTLAVVSNYGGGTVSIYTLNTDGGLKSTLQVFDQNTETIKSHAHSAHFSGDDLFVSDLGRNNLFRYTRNEKEGKYSLITTDLLSYADNSGPRHFVLMDNGEDIYSIAEYANTITFAQKTSKGYEVKEVYKTLDPQFEGESFGADIHYSKDGRFVYASNRGENTIAVFQRNETNGLLKLIQNESVRGDWPRNFALDPSGRFLLVANQRSKNISVFKINAKTGMLSFQKNLDFPVPVCLIFK